MDPGCLRNLHAPKQRVVTGEDEAIAAATELGFPVALKIVSTTITHKTEGGGVAVDLRTPDDVRAAYRDVLRRLTALGRRNELSGILVQGW